MLAILLLVLSLSILHAVLTTGSFGGPLKIKEPMILLVGPLLLFYVRESMGTRTVMRRKLFHFVPFFLFFVIALLMSVLGTSSPYYGSILRHSAEFSIGVWVLIVLQYGFYWSATVHTIHKNIRLVESEFSNVEGKTMSWLRVFLHAFGILLVLFTATVVFVIHTGHYSEADTIVSFGLSCVIFVLGFEGLFQEEIFQSIPGGVTEPVKTSVRVGSRDNQMSGERVSSEQEEALSKRIVKSFEKERPYLNEDLTLTGLAAQMNVSRNLLSSTINNVFGTNFYNLVNRYRVDEVKRLISDPANKDFTILSLAFQAGFRSKSSFQGIFKKFTGMTPSEYQGRIQNPNTETGGSRSDEGQR
jgi:AraC-like DNA-binding protein